MKVKFVILLFSILLFSCSSDTKPSKMAKAKQTKTTQTATKSGKSNADYWTSLQKDLKIDDKKLASLKSIVTKNRREIAKLKKEKTLTKAKRNHISKRTDNQISKLLGKNLFNKKAAFDEKWKASKK